MWDAILGIELPQLPGLTILASLVLSARREHPFPNWRLSGIFPEVVARALASLPIQPPTLAGLSGRRELHNAARRYFAGPVLNRHPVTRDVAEAFQSPLVARAFARALGAELDGAFVRIEYAADPDGFWLEPHTDLGAKKLSLLIQLAADGQEDLGTDLYAGPCEWCDRVPFAWNGALAFVPSDRSWHGFEPRRIEGVRRSIIVNYVSDEWRAREQLAFPDDPVRVS